MKNLKIILIYFIISYCPVLSENDTIFKPEGKFIIQVINRTNLDLLNTDNFGMNINRAHFGYSYQFAKEWKGVVVLDAGRPTLFNNLIIKDSLGNSLSSEYIYQEGSFYTMTLKFSYLEYKPNKIITLQIGGILQNHYITEEKFWGYRYILESFPDRYFRIPSGDLGVIGYFVFNEHFSADLAITNGEGFRRKQDDYGKFKVEAGLDFKPFDWLVTRIYYDNTFANETDIIKNEELYSVFIGYIVPSKFRTGFDYHYQSNYHHLAGLDLFGYSIYGAYNITDNFESFLRYDNLQNNYYSDCNAIFKDKSSGKAYILGFHYKPIQGISLSLSEQIWEPKSIDYKLQNEIVFSFEYRI